VVGKAGFEPAISRSRTERDTRLRYFPNDGQRIARSRTECSTRLSRPLWGESLAMRVSEPNDQRAPKTTPFVIAKAYATLAIRR
jgi:hypothetical protein